MLLFFFVIFLLKGMIVVPIGLFYITWKNNAQKRIWPEFIAMRNFASHTSWMFHYVSCSFPHEYVHMPAKHISHFSLTFSFLFKNWSPIIIRLTTVLSLISIFASRPTNFTELIKNRKQDIFHCLSMLWFQTLVSLIQTSVSTNNAHYNWKLLKYCYFTWMQANTSAWLLKHSFVIGIDLIWRQEASWRCVFFVLCMLNQDRHQLSSPANMLIVCRYTSLVFQLCSCMMVFVVLCFSVCLRAQRKAAW